MNSLKDILGSIKPKQIIGNENITINELCFDSRKVVPGS